jgi:cytochrome c oxidase cbb3-type subunit 3
MAKEEIDAFTGTATTGHEWDGIKELNTPLPRWWLWLFYITVIWSVAYWIVYPAWPLVSSYTRGVFGYSSRADVAAELAALQQLRGEKGAALAKADIADIEKDPNLLAFARYPNLNDDDWLWGGSLPAIYQTIEYGIRSGDPQARENQMPAFGKDEVLTKDQVAQVANYVRSLAGLPVRQGVDLTAGKQIFADNCSVCHGEDGNGNPELGAPSFTDRIWLFGSDEADIIESINTGRGGVMPAWHGRLDPATIKALTVYVHSLGGGQ